MSAGTTSDWSKRVRGAARATERRGSGRAVCRPIDHLRLPHARRRRYHKRSVDSASALSAVPCAATPPRPTAGGSSGRGDRGVRRARPRDVPVDEIARRAGVGIGTLYRRFPTQGRARRGDLRGAPRPPRRAGRGGAAGRRSLARGSPAFSSGRSRCRPTNRGFAAIVAVHLRDEKLARRGAEPARDAARAR